MRVNLVRGKPRGREVCQVIMREYEMMFILSLEGGDDSIPGLIEKVNNMITRYGGEITETNTGAPWGRRRLAYPINRLQEGYYILNYFKMNPSGVEELERDLRISEDVLRHLLISLGKD